MKSIVSRRSMLAGGAAVAAASALPVRAQQKQNIRFAAVFTERDIRARMIEMFA
jgi:hypothetical protein